MTSAFRDLDRVGEGVVVTVVDASDRRLDACLCQPLGISNGHILNAAVRVAYEAAMNGTLQGIEDKLGMCRSAHSPTDDAPSKSVDHEGPVNEALPVGDIGELRNSQPVRRRSFELAVHPVQWAGSRLVRECRADRLSSNDTLQAHRPHNPSDSATGDIEAFTLQLPPDLPNAIDAEVLLEDTTDLDLQADIAAGADRQAIHIHALGQVLVVG
jgi:hypothetical protein